MNIPYVKIPLRAFYCDLSHAEKEVMIQLFICQFHFCKSDGDCEFYVTDRELADTSKVST